MVKKKPQPVKDKAARIAIKKIKKPAHKPPVVEVKPVHKRQKHKPAPPSSPSEQSEAQSEVAEPSERNSRSPPFQPEALLNAFLPRLETQIRKQMLEAQPILFERLRASFSEEVQSLRALVENIREAVTLKCQAIEKSFEGHFKHLSMLVEKDRAGSSDTSKVAESKEEADRSMVLETGSKRDEIAKRLRKRGRVPSIDKLRAAEPVFPSIHRLLTEELPQKKKRGRKPKSHYLERMTSNTLDNHKAPEQDSQKDRSAQSEASRQERPTKEVESAQAESQQSESQADSPSRPIAINNLTLVNLNPPVNAPPKPQPVTPALPPPVQQEAKPVIVQPPIRDIAVVEPVILSDTNEATVYPQHSSAFSKPKPVVQAPAPVAPLPLITMPPRSPYGTIRPPEVVLVLSKTSDHRQQEEAAQNCTDDEATHRSSTSDSKYRNDKELFSFN